MVLHSIYQTQELFSNLGSKHHQSLEGFSHLVAVLVEPWRPLASPAIRSPPAARFARVSCRALEGGGGGKARVVYCTGHLRGNSQSPPDIEAPATDLWARRRSSRSGGCAAEYRPDAGSTWQMKDDRLDERCLDMEVRGRLIIRLRQK